MTGRARACVGTGHFSAFELSVTLTLAMSHRPQRAAAAAADTYVGAELLSDDDDVQDQVPITTRRRKRKTADEVRRELKHCKQQLEVSQQHAAALEQAEKARKEKIEAVRAEFRVRYQCTVCLDVPSEPQRLSCNHYFCKPCLEGLDLGNGCPNCREDTLFDPTPADFTNYALVLFGKVSLLSCTQLCVCVCVAY
jgi:hypothetical protein